MLGLHGWVFERVFAPFDMFIHLSLFLAENFVSRPLSALAKDMIFLLRNGITRGVVAVVPAAQS
jgi:hypothetical protein